MSPQGPDFPDIKKINAELFRDIDPADIQDLEYLERVQQNCVEQVNPFICYLTVVLGKEPRVTWRHNTGNHFGLVNLQFDDLIELIHPAWKYLYVAYGKAMYEVAFKYSEEFVQSGATAIRQLPMLHRSGQYYWYHQVSIGVTKDGGGHLAAHLNYYQQNTTYVGQLPSMPQMASSGGVYQVGTKELNRLGLEFMPGFLRQFLSETQVEFMLQYRKIIFENGGEKVKGDLSQLIDKVETFENVNKLKQRIRLKVKDYFMHPTLDSAYGLALWLNRYFPLLDE